MKPLAQKLLGILGPAQIAEDLKTAFEMLGTEGMGPEQCLQLAYLTGYACAQDDLKSAELQMLADLAAEGTNGPH